MQPILRTFYNRWKSSTWTSRRSARSAEEVSGRDLSTFFAQCLHSNALYDYGMGRVERRADAPAGGGVRGWRWCGTRRGRFRSMWACSPRATPRSRAPTGIADAGMGGDRHGAASPARCVLDPLVRCHDWNRLNNGSARSASSERRRPKHRPLFAPVFLDPARGATVSGRFHAGRVVQRSGGVTLGLRERDRLSRAVRTERRPRHAEHGMGRGRWRHDTDFLLRFRNPVRLRAPASRRSSMCSGPKVATARARPGRADDSMSTSASAPCAGRRSRSSGSGSMTSAISTPGITTTSASWSSPRKRGDDARGSWHLAAQSIARRRARLQPRRARGERAV